MQQYASINWPLLQETAVRMQAAYHDDFASSMEPGRQELSLLLRLSFCDARGGFLAAHRRLCADADSAHECSTQASHQELSGIRACI